MVFERFSGLLLTGTEIRPERWDNLTEAAKAMPGVYSHTLSFLAGPNPFLFSLSLYLAHSWCTHRPPRMYRVPVLSSRVSVLS
jgi:hypothetical protein